MIIVRRFCGAALLLLAFTGTAAAQVTLSSLPAEDPAARLLAGLLVPMLAGDEPAAAEYLRRHGPPGAGADAMLEQLREALSALHERPDPRLGDFFLASDGRIVAAIESEAGQRLWLVSTMPDDRSAILSIGTPAGGWHTPPPPPEPAIAGLLDRPAMHATVAFVGVNVVPMDRERVLRDRTVLVRDGRIAAIGSRRSVRVPADALVVEGAGRWLMPGLAEMHAHIPWPQQGPGAMDRSLFLYLAHGVTTVRGMQGHASHLELRDRAAAGEILAPRIITSGPPLTGQIAGTIEQAVAQVEAQHAAGYDFLKIPYGQNREVYEAVVAAARRVGIPFAGHVWADVGLDGALAARQTTIDHLDAYIEALSGFGAGFSHDQSGFFGLAMLDQVDDARLRGVVAATRQAGVWNVPTLSWVEHTLSAYPVDELMARPEMAFLPRNQVRGWAEFTEQLRAGEGADPDRRARYLELRRRIVHELHRGGAELLLGSDAPQLWNAPGRSIEQELAMLVEAGLTPFQALETGTRNPARFLGADDWGTIATGKVADLVLLEANPLDDVAALNRRAGVMVRGAWLSEDEIQARLARIRYALGAG